MEEISLHTALIEFSTESDSCFYTTKISVPNLCKNDYVFWGYKVPTDKKGQLGLCEGNCNRNSDCSEGLYCFERHHHNELTPGCEGKPYNEWVDYCVNLPSLPISGVQSANISDVSSAPSNAPSTGFVPSNASNGTSSFPSNAPSTSIVLVGSNLSSELPTGTGNMMPWIIISILSVMGLTATVAFSYYRVRLNAKAQEHHRMSNKSIGYYNNGDDEEEQQKGK